MKKIIHFALLAATSVIALVSCNKEIETPDLGTDAACPEGYYVEELTAVYPHDPETRTAFNETTGRFAWTAGDELAFHLSNGEYVAAPIDPATGKVKLYLPVGVTRDNYAVYPASAVVDEAAAIGNMKVTLPATYDISADPNTDFVPTPLVAWNDAENTHLKFEHVGGLLQVNLNVPAGVKTAKLNMGKTITGTFSLEDGTGNGIITPGASSADDGITFVISEDGLAEDTEVKLLAPLPTGTYDHFEVAYDNGFEFSRDLSATPWTFSRSGGKKVSIGEDKFEDATDYFWIEALEANSVVSFRHAGSYGGVYYSYDKKNWQYLEFTEQTAHPFTIENEGQRVWFYELKLGYGDDFFDPNGYFSHGHYIQGTGKYKIGGNILSLASRTLDKPMTGGSNGFDGYCAAFFENTALVDASELILPDNLIYDCYSDMFEGCVNLVAPPVLPAVASVPKYAYQEMFKNCSSLTEFPDLQITDVAESGCAGMFSGTAITKAPAIPATTLGKNCYANMFSGCLNLTQAPELPATTMAEGCYSNMFRRCTSLVVAPALPSTELAKSCYSGMFNECTSLTQAPELPALTLYASSYNQMFYKCESLVDAPELPATTLGDNCYYQMFAYCSELVNGPTILPAIEVPYYACYGMFYVCKKLAKAPKIMAKKLDSWGFAMMFASCPALSGTVDIPVEELLNSKNSSMSCNLQSMFSDSGVQGVILHFKDANQGYVCRYMFDGCKQLKTITVDLESWPTATDAMTNWVRGVPATKAWGGVFNKPVSLTTARGNNRIPNNWTVNNATDLSAGI